MNLITASEVINLSINQGNIDAELIKENIIKVAELENIKSFLTDDLYKKISDENKTGSFTGKNKELLDNYLKPSLAYFVKSKFILENGIRTTNSGSMVNESEVARSATRGERADQIEEAKLNGKTFLGEARKFIDDNKDDFPDFEIGESVKVGKLRGGIII